MSIVVVSPRSSAFSQVLVLWGKERTTLGLMPEGGFEDAARAGELLLAEGPQGTAAGYVMFRRTRQRTVTIVHLCVDPSQRRTGVARRLFDAVKTRCSDCFEIRVTCRRDFSANSIWHKLGFVALGEKPGRARASVLTLWRYELNQLPLLRAIESERLGFPGAVRAIIDANVFFDLDDDAPVRHESRALLVDWLDEFVEFAITQELYNEINRREHQGDRDRQRARAARFVQVPRDAAREEAVLSAIRQRLPASNAPSALSDARQLAMAIAGDVTFFVTRDQEVLDFADYLYDAFGLQVMPPHEIIRCFDELRREDDYRPRRLFLGPDVRSSLARAEDLEALADLVHQGNAAPEPYRRTLGRLRDMLADPDRFQITLIRKGTELLAAYALDRTQFGELVVPLLAVPPTPLGRTAARHYTEWLSNIAASESRLLIRVENVGTRLVEALTELDFSQEGDAWLKLTLNLAMPADELAIELERAATAIPRALPLARRMAETVRAIASPSSGATHTAAAERALWPAKITSSRLPSFLVPIRPDWAKDLFDQGLAELTLFGANPNLVLNCENVYYRAARPAVITAPSRVLWYVSDDSAYPQSKAVRACSLVEEVVVGKPKDLFRRFRRIGVYEWKDIYALAGDDIGADIMAFRFTKTQLLRRPIPWAHLQDILRQETGKANQLASPVLISETCFLHLYRQGMNDAA